MPSGTMPPKVAEILEWLRDDLLRIHERWALYRRTFGVDEARIDLLNRVAPLFFGHAQWSISKDVILALCRFTDPPGVITRKGEDRRNWTLARLVELVTADDAIFGGALATNEWAAVQNCRTTEFKEFRDTAVAHNAISRQMARLNGQAHMPSRERVGRFLTLCTTVMQKVHEHYIGCPFCFDFFVQDAERSADALNKVLEDFAKRHTADVEAGRAIWMIRPPKGWPNIPRTE